MSPAPASPKAAPDRVFARAVAVSFAAALAVVLATHLGLERARRHEAAAAELAMTATAEAAAARAVVGALDRLAALPEDAAAATRLGWELDRLVALEARRLAAHPALAAERNALDAVVTAARGRPTGTAAAALHADLEAHILPQLDRIAATSQAAAARARDHGGRLLAASLALQFGAAAALAVAVVRPAGRRIAEWTARTTEEARETRFRLLHDPLTGMPNAAYLHAYLTRLAAGSQRARAQTAVLRIDLDRFRVLREALGQSCCDEVLRIAARRIQRALRSGDFAACLGQDDFVVVASDLDDGNGAATIAARVQGALAKPFSIRGGAPRLTCSIGVTLLADDRPDAERALANAEIALGEAQGAGPGNVRYFQEALRREVERRETLFAELLHGLQAGQVLPFFQPQLETATGRFCGFEALVRWQHPEHGLMEPAAFLDFAEQTDLGERMGELVLTRSLEALVAWDKAGLAVPRVGVNFALAQLRGPRLVEKIKWEVERFGIEPDRIAIEVLETVLIKSDTDLAVRNLRGLASAGFHVELDDFGTGHASIANLRRFMVDRIKIDRSFVAGIEASAEQRALTGSMVAMAHALGIGTLAEGVETEAERAVLAELGCDRYQGFLGARPMAFAETLAWLGRQGAAAAPSATERAGQGDPNSP
jgi:diguanylate cyclase (GGDEF)-like protein